MTVGYIAVGAKRAQPQRVGNRKGGGGPSMALRLLPDPSDEFVWKFMHIDAGASLQWGTGSALCFEAMDDTFREDMGGAQWGGACHSIVSPRSEPQ
jgi:hypothetical protein